MVVIGYHLSSEEHPPQGLVDYACRAEAAGFQFALISDHFHPWLDVQGHSPFAWGVLGAIANATTTLGLGTGVTCPLLRYHPAIIAQATATTAMLCDGRFALGLGTGENINEHIVGGHWPTSDVRRAMLAEAVEVIRRLWTGEWVEYHGDYCTVEQARLYSLPDAPPPLYVAASGTQSAELAGRIADGLIATVPKPSLPGTFARAGGADKPRYGKLTLCYAPDEADARAIAHRWFRAPQATGPLNPLLRTPSDFAAATRYATPDDVAGTLFISNDPAAHVREIRRYADAGYSHVYVHQVGPKQREFFDFYARQVLPHL